MSPKFIGFISLVALLAASASSLQAEPRKKGGRSKSRTTKVESSSSSSTTGSPPSSLFESSLPPASPPPPPAVSKPIATPDGAAPAEADTPPDPDASRPTINLLPMVLVGVEPLWEGRVFRQSEGLEPERRKYGAIGYPSIALNAELYPLANVKAKFLRGFGVTFHIARAFGFESDSTRLEHFGAWNEAPADTSFMRYAAGLRYRIHANPDSDTPFVFGISASLRRWFFSFAPALPLGPDLEVPTADYRMLRLGVDGALEVKSRVAFYGAAYYLHAFSVAAPNTRELDTVTNPYLANAAGMGAELRGAVGVRLARWIELRLSLEYAITTFHIKGLRDGDAPDRVLDSYLSAGLGPYVKF
jgi:hypothetical protein